MQHAEERFLRDAYKNRDRDTQRKALSRLLELGHSKNTESKKFAAANFKYYITLFPDLEEEVINAIYDLCEDGASLVRIQGYQAIAAVSKQDSRWVKRNADVLVQLLQSDEPDEVFYIRKGLDEHLDLEPTVTIGVLCDSVGPGPGVEEQEQEQEQDEDSVERLRTLVLGFLSERMKKILLIMKDEAGSEPERILVEGVVRAIPKSGIEDTTTIIRDILLALPSYRKRTPEGEQILLLVLDKAEKVLSEELREVNDGGSTSLDGTRRYLELAGNVMATASRQQPLWKFYFDFVVDRINSLTPDTQLWLVQTVLAIVDSYGDVDRSADAREARRQACDHSQALFKVLADCSASDQTFWKACKTLLKLCVERQKDSWALSQEAVESVRRIQQEKTNMDHSQDIHDLIRPLLQVQVNLASASPDPASGNSWRPNKRKHDFESADRPGSRQMTPPNLSSRQTERPTTTSSLIGEILDKPRSPKRTMVEEPEGQPSLLSRLDPSRDVSNNGTRYPSPKAGVLPQTATTTTSHRGSWRGAEPPRRTMQLPPSLPKKPDVPMPMLEVEHMRPVPQQQQQSGLSIKGAANRTTVESNGNGNGDGYGGGGHGRNRTGDSLLNRLHDDRNLKKKRRGGRA